MLYDDKKTIFIKVFGKNVKNITLTETICEAPQEKILDSTQDSTSYVT